MDRAGEAPYREPAEIARDIPPSPRPKRVWTRGDRIAFWGVFGVLILDACLVLGQWAHWGRVDTAWLVGVNTVCLVLWRIGRLA